MRPLCSFIILSFFSVVFLGTAMAEGPEEYALGEDPTDSSNAQDQVDPGMEEDPVPDDLPPAPSSLTCSDFKYNNFCHYNKDEPEKPFAFINHRTGDCTAMCWYDLSAASQTTGSVICPQDLDGKVCGWSFDTSKDCLDQISEQKVYPGVFITLDECEALAGTFCETKPQYKEEESGPISCTEH